MHLEFLVFLMHGGLQRMTPVLYQSLCSHHVPCHSVWPFHSDAGLGQVTDFRQWDVGWCNKGRNLEGTLHYLACSLLPYAIAMRRTYLWASPRVDERGHPGSANRQLTLTRVSATSPRQQISHHRTARAQPSATRATQPQRIVSWIHVYCYNLVKCYDCCRVTSLWQWLTGWQAAMLAGRTFLFRRPGRMYRTSSRKSPCEGETVSGRDWLNRGYRIIGKVEKNPSGSREVEKVWKLELRIQVGVANASLSFL